MTCEESRTRTSLPSRVLQLRVSSDHHNFHHQAVAALSDHVDHLPVAHLHHVTAVHLQTARKEAVKKD
ncbi:hypothetical protein EYF80_039367 [Liparis tanakae]|uniref:Uncharacterized protein n=1 Tax=Liparis tanakae TaxID=230148 RepID=A0A4Z2GB63_9TELE|nr:hypothetical protein EYF80_039367 [Liparis tanakae]